MRFCCDFDADGNVVLEDTRPLAPVEHMTLDPVESAVFLGADAVTTVTHLVRGFATAEGPAAGLDAARVQAVLDDLERRRIVHREGDRYLALANRQTGREGTPRVAGGVNKSYLWRQVEKHTERRTP